MNDISVKRMKCLVFVLLRFCFDQIIEREYGESTWVINGINECVQIEPMCDTAKYK